MNNEIALNAIKNYLRNLWRLKAQHIFDVLEIVSIFIMLIVAIITNNDIPQEVFIPLLVIFSIVSFFSEAYIGMSRHEYYETHKKYNNEQDIIANDLLRVPIIVRSDLKMRITRYQESVSESNKNIRQFHEKKNWSNLISTIFETISQYSVIIIFLIGVQWNNITLETIAEITATLLIVETAMGYIRNITYTLNGHNEGITILEEEEKDMIEILKVYYQEIEKINQSKPIDKIELPPFGIQYIEESDNDKAFQLVSQKPIKIKSGEVVILTGVSGSGKSTWLKLVLQRIKLEKNEEIPSTSRYSYYDEKQRLGSFSIFEELFCCQEKPDLSKMQKILENLNLWQEIKANCFDVWTWMEEKRYGNTLSNGQNQRLILAKILYWMNEEIDIVALDEATSGLDDKSENGEGADAQGILEYIVNYCNNDKKRIVLISTHQNLDEFKKRIEYPVRQLHFEKNGDIYQVREI